MRSSTDTATRADPGGQPNRTPHVITCRGATNPAQRRRTTMHSHHGGEHPIPAAARWLRLHQRVSHRPGLYRCASSPNLWRYKRSHEDDYCQRHGPLTRPTSGHLGVLPHATTPWYFLHYEPSETPTRFDLADSGDRTTTALDKLVLGSRIHGAGAAHGPQCCKDLTDFAEGGVMQQLTGLDTAFLPWPGPPRRPDNRRAQRRNQRIIRRVRGWLTSRQAPKYDREGSRDIEDDAEARPSRHHPLVGLGRLRKCHDLIHRADAPPLHQLQVVLVFDGATGQ